MKIMRKPNPAFTLVELLVVIAMLAMLSACLLPALARTRPQVLRLACASNLKQVGIAFHTWATENDGNNPMNVAGAGTTPASQDAGGAAGVASGGISYLYQVFRCMSNELSTPKILICPAEMDGSLKYAATTFASRVTVGSEVPFTSNANLSYFVGWDAYETGPRMFLDGDHSLGQSTTPGTTTPAINPYRAKWVALGTNSTQAPLNGAAWTDSSQHQKRGNVGLSDGSVEGFSINALRTAAANTADPTHSAGPGFLPPGANRLGFGDCPSTPSS